jgi:pyruvate dehydrogenase E1 component alpha subunit
MVTNELLQRMYLDMQQIRIVEERIVELYPDNQIRCPVHLSIGQEAIAAGVSASLELGDHVFSGHRSHAHYIAKGGNLRSMMGELYGRSTGCCRGRGGSMHLVDTSVGFMGSIPIVGSAISIAVGAALGSLWQDTNRVTVVYFGDGATEEGVFHEALNYAMLRKLPVLFVCENNLFSVYSPLRVRQPAGRTICQLVRGHGMEAESHDGNDAVGVFERSKLAVDRVRAGKGPFFLEFMTYRWREHCGVNHDESLEYNSSLKAWKKRDPILIHEAVMLDQGFTVSDFKILTDVARLRCEDAVKFAKESPFPDRGELVNL